MLAAAAMAGEGALAAQQALLLQPLLSQPDKLKLLVSAGREVRDELDRLREEPELAGLVPFLLELVSNHMQGIPALRRVIRRHAVVVPFASPKLTIRALGKTQVKCSDHMISGSDWQVQTARDLFFLLLAHPDGLNKEEIGEIFWPDSSTSELRLRFKNTIYRLRHAAGKDVILFQGESTYLFNREIDYEYDVEAFQKELALAASAQDRQEQEQRYQAAVRLYRGAFLSDAEGAWVEIERERLRQDFMDAVLSLAEMSLAARAYEKALEYCQRAHKEDRCQEDAHRIAMRVHAAMGNRALVIRQYEQCRQALLEEVDAPPSVQTTTLYETLMK
jgi:DNA-binding SARP family transcriptional activator